MPSVSKKQHNLMALVANDPKAAKRLGIPQSVGRDFIKADKGRKFGDSDMKKDVKRMQSGGLPKDERALRAVMGRQRVVRPAMPDRMGRPMVSNMKKGGKAESKKMVQKELAFMKKKGAPKSMIRHEEEEMEGKKMRKFRSGGEIKKYAGREGSVVGVSNPYFSPYERNLIEAIRHTVDEQSGFSRGGPQYRWSRGAYQAGMQGRNVTKNPLPIGPKILSDERSQAVKNLSPREAKMYDRVMRERQRQMDQGFDRPSSDTAEIQRLTQHFTGAPMFVEKPGGGRETTADMILREMQRQAEMRKKPQVTVEELPAETPAPAPAPAKTVGGGGGGGFGAAGGPRSYADTGLQNFLDQYYMDQMMNQDRKRPTVTVEELTGRGMRRGGSVKPRADKAGRAMKRRSADTMGRAMVKGYKEGGSVHSSYRKGADGIASKGKTKGKIVKMRYGGEC